MSYHPAAFEWVRGVQSFAHLATATHNPGSGLWTAVAQPVARLEVMDRAVTAALKDQHG